MDLDQLGLELQEDVGWWRHLSHYVRHHLLLGPGEGRLNQQSLVLGLIMLRPCINPSAWRNQSAGLSSQ